MCRTHTHGGKTGSQSSLAAWPPTNVLPGRRRQTQGQLLHRSRLMICIALQARRSCSMAWFSRRGRQGVFSRFPPTWGSFNTSYIIPSQVGCAGAEVRIVPIPCIGQYHSHRNLLLQRLPNLLQGNLRLGLKLHSFGNPGLPAAFGVLTPHLRQVQPPGDRQTRVPRANRQTHGHLAVVLFAYLTAVLPGNSYRVLPLLGKASVIHDPSHHRPVRLHGRQHLTPHLSQHLLVVPRRICHQVVERLVLATNIVWSQTCRHRLDTLALAGQQQSSAVVLQRCVPVGMPRGVSQALDICREAPLLWAWRREA